MNSNTKSKNYKDTWTLTDYEFKAIEHLNSDQNKTYQPISQAPAIRESLVMAAMLRCPNIFQLCKNTSRYARLTHNHFTDRMPTTINFALQKMAEEKPARKPARKMKAQGMAA